MECLDTTKYLKINLKRSIGTVLIIVEGEKDEFLLLKHIFRDVLKYDYIEKKRNRKSFKEYDEFVMKWNQNSRVIVINAKNSNISTLVKDKDYINEIYKILYLEYGIDTKYCRVYFIWDRDNASNRTLVVKNMLKMFGNSLDNGTYMNGMLLLSYPSVEAYIISNFDKKRIFIRSDNLKKYVKNRKYYIDNINKDSIRNAVPMMHKSMKKLGINKYDFDNFSETSLRLFENEEKIYKIKGYYYLLSLVSIILLDLNIIAEREFF